MGNCLSSSKKYKAKSWENAALELVSGYNELDEDEKVLPMENEKGSSGFPFKTNKGHFIKIVMKTRRNTHFKIMMQLKNLAKHCPNETYLLLPQKYVETENALLLHYELCDMDFVKYLNSQSMPPNIRDKMIWGIINAVKYLHSKNFVHRDIKLDNILLRNGRPVLCDNDYASSADEFHIKGTKEYLPHGKVLNHLFNVRQDISTSTKNKFVDCYALGKTITQFLIQENVKKDKRFVKPSIIKIWEDWLFVKQGSIQTLNIDEEDLKVHTKWWEVVLQLCKYNERKVFTKGKFYLINDIKSFSGHVTRRLEPAAVE